MAANSGVGFIVDDLESVNEEKRVTLLDAIEERNRTLNKKSILHRMVVISALRHDNYNEVIGYFEKFFKDYQLQTQCEGVTGLLLFYPSHSVHVVEGSLEILLEFCRELKSDLKKQRHASSAKILVVSHDIPCRLYQSWMSRTVDIQAANMELYEPTEGAEKVVIDILTQLLKLGVFIHKNQKKASLDGLNENTSELLPDQAAINYLLKHDEPCIYTPDEYLRQYETPFDVTLTEDLVWPLPIRKFPYN